MTKLKNVLFSILGSRIVSSVLDVTTAYEVKYGVPKRGLEKMLNMNNCTVFGQSVVKLSISSGKLSSLLDISNTTNGEASAVMCVEVLMRKLSRVKLNMKDSYMTDLGITMSEYSYLEINLTKCFFGFSDDNIRSHYCNKHTHNYSFGIKIKQERHSHLVAKVIDSVGKQSDGITINAIKQELTYFRVYNSTFNNNHQVIYIYSSGQILRVYIFNVTFTSKVSEHHDHAVSITTVQSYFVELIKCKFFSNIGYRGVCIFFQSQSLMDQSHLYLNELTLVRNFDIGLDSAIILILFCHNVTVRNSIFVYNYGTPIELIHSTIFFDGYTSFEANTARKGGGLSLINSKVEFTTWSKTVFRSNKALDVGGAIFVSHDTVHHKFFNGLLQKRQVLRCKFRVSSKNVQLDFQNNSAVNGGDEVYGTYLYRDCFTSTEHVTILNKESLKNLFKLHNSLNTSLSAISSDPLRVCICDSRGQPQCARLEFIYLNVTLFPGERFTVPLVVVGEEFGIVAGTAHATLLSQTSGSLGRGQNAQRTAVRQCTLAEYSVHSSRQSETLLLTAFGGAPFAVEEIKFVGICC